MEGATERAAKHQPHDTRPRVEKSLEVEAREAGHSLAGEASRANGEGAEELEESRSLRWVDKSSNGEEPCARLRDETNP